VCGIIHVKRKNGILANKAVIKRYYKQKSRGSEGFGFIELKNGKVIGGKRAENEKDIINELEKSEADEILFHHRFPTSTPNFIEATHPIEVKHKSLKYNYYVVHNGVITNDEDLKEKFEKEGFTYTTKMKKQWITQNNTYSTEIFNDSESLAIDIAKAIENNTTIKSNGAIAVIALQVDKKTKKAVALYFGRNYGNPLKMESMGDFFGLSSEEGKLLDTNFLYRYDYETGEIVGTKKDIGSYAVSYSQYDYDIPDYGHYDPNTGAWVNTKKTNSLYSGVYDENDYPYAGSPNESIDDFIYDWDIMIDDLEDEIKEAKRLENWDRVSELQDELADAKTKYDQLVSEAYGGKNPRMGF
jgi:glutamine phosphoribosylpyrophosphate amidotransferase